MIKENIEILNLKPDDVIIYKYDLSEELEIDRETCEGIIGLFPGHTVITMPKTPSHLLEITSKEEAIKSVRNVLKYLEEAPDEY